MDLQEDNVFPVVVPGRRPHKRGNVDVGSTLAGNDEGGVIGDDPLADFQGSQDFPRVISYDKCDARSGTKSRGRRYVINGGAQSMPTR